MQSIVKLPEPGELIDETYELVREVGRGAFGVVFEARDVSLGRRVAVKMLLPHVITKNDIVERFQREARLASSLTSKHSVTVFGFGVHGEAENVVGIPFMAMEFLEGEDLKGYLQRHLVVPLDEGASILVQALMSLEEGHSRGIVHRDLKPSNIFLASDGDSTVAKVLDFGIAKAIRGDWEEGDMNTLTQTGAVFGTPQYMAPEQAKGEAGLGPAADVYSMGCIGYEMITGVPPFDGASPMDIALKHMTEDVPWFEGEAAAHPMGRAVMIALRKDPATRFPDAGAFRHALETGEMPDEPAKRTNWGAIGAVAAAVVLFIGVAVGAVALMADAENSDAEIATATVTDPEASEGLDEANKAEAGDGQTVATAGVNEGTDSDINFAIDEAALTQVTIRVTSTPGGATVKAGDEVLGTTPLSKAVEASNEPLELRLEKDGFQPRIVSLNIEQDSNIMLDLKPIAADSVRNDGRRGGAKRGGTRRGNTTKPPKDDKPKDGFKVPLWKKP